MKRLIAMGGLIVLLAGCGSAATHHTVPTTPAPTHTTAAPAVAAAPPPPTVAPSAPTQPAATALQESCKVTFSAANGWQAVITLYNPNTVAEPVPSLGAAFLGANGQSVDFITGALSGPGITTATTIAGGQTMTFSGPPTNLNDAVSGNPPVAADQNPALAPYFAACQVVPGY
jgi:hypothetical protein